jgi:hypothetical protein
MVFVILVVLCQNCYAVEGINENNIFLENQGNIILSQPEIVAGQVIVAIKLGYEDTIINESTLSALGVASVEDIFKSKSYANFVGHTTWLFKLKDNSYSGVYDVISKLKQYSCVDYAEPNHIYHVS